MRRLKILLISIPIVFSLGGSVIIAQSEEGNKNTSKKSLSLRPISRDENTVRQANYKKGLIIKSKHNETNKSITTNKDNRNVKPNKEAINNQRAATLRNRSLMRNRINRR